MVTVNKIAEKLGIDRTTANGLVSACVKTGCLKASGSVPKAPGERGRPELQYEITDDVVSSVASLLATLIEAEKAEAAPATSTEETCTMLTEQPAPSPEPQADQTAATF